MMGQITQSGSPYVQCSSYLLPIGGAPFNGRSIANMSPVEIPPEVAMLEHSALLMLFGILIPATATCLIKSTCGSLGVCRTVMANEGNLVALKFPAAQPQVPCSAAPVQPRGFIKPTHICPYIQQGDGYPA